MSDASFSTTFAYTNNMKIRKATYEDIPRILHIFAEARTTMRESGNLHQWPDTYPSEEIVRKDISNGHCMVCCDEEGKIQGTFACIPGPDPTYAKIYEGCWPDEEPYYVIHRIAASRDAGRKSSIASCCFEWTFRRTDTIRIDTHRDNVIMHHLLSKHGFHRCGVILLANGDPRDAYHKRKI